MNKYFTLYSYLTIVTEILSVVIRKYWNFLDTHFNNGEFLELLLQYTFRHVALDCYYQCLDIWGSIFEALSDRPGCVEKLLSLFIFKLYNNLCIYLFILGIAVYFWILLSE